MNSLFRLIASARRRPALPSTINVSYALVATGLNGSINPTTTAGRTRFIAPAGATTPGITSWVAEITGTSATINMQAANAAQSGFIQVSVDGGAFTEPASISTNIFPLFTGLPNAKHLVRVILDPAFGSSNGWMVNTGNPVAVTGVNPVCAPALYTYSANSGTANVYTAGTFVATPVDYAPATASLYAVSNYSSISSVAFKSTTTRLLLCTNYFSATAITGYAYLSIDGATPVRYGRSLGGVISVPCDGASHTYRVWCGHYNGLSVGTDGAFETLAAQKRIFQFGDSITYGRDGTTTGEVETFGVAASLGCIGSTLGKTGQTVEGLYADLTALLAGITTDNTTDVAVLAIGRNNVGAAWTATTDSNYASTITQLLTKFKKVICRGIINDGSGGVAPYLPSNTLWTTENGKIQTAVTNAANANVTYVDPSSWTDVATADGTHPTDTGYATLVGHCVTAYTGKI